MSELAWAWIFIGMCTVAIAVGVSLAFLICWIIKMVYIGVCKVLSNR